MSDTFSKVEVIIGVARRRRFSTDLKLAVVAETMQPGMSISYVARRHGLSPSLVFRWRRLMSEGGREAVRADDEVVPVTELRRLEERVRDLERLLGLKSMEVGVGEDVQARLRPGEPDPQCCCRPRPDRSLDGGLQHRAPPFPVGESRVTMYNSPAGAGSQFASFRRPASLSAHRVSVRAFAVLLQVRQHRRVDVVG
jgi:transposase